MQRVESKIEDAVLIEVNGTAVSLRHIVRQLGVADDLRFFDRFARGELIRQLAQREGIGTTREDIQRKVDAWRYRHRLERVEDTEAWLAQRGITLQDVAEDAEVSRLEYLLSQKIADGQIDPYFAQHTLAFDEAEICWIFHADRGVIDEIDVQIREDGADFYAMARRFSQDAHSCQRALPPAFSPRRLATSSARKKYRAGSRCTCCNKSIRQRQMIASKKRFANACSTSGYSGKCNGQIYSIQFGQREIGLDALVKAEILPRAFGNGNREPFDSASII